LTPAEGSFSLFFKRLSFIGPYHRFAGNWVQICTRTSPVAIKLGSLLRDRFYQSARETEAREEMRGRALLDKHSQDGPL